MTVDLSLLPDGGVGWLDASGAHADIVLSTRIRLARNLAEFPFISRATPQDRIQIERILREGILTSRLYHAGKALLVEQSVPLKLSDHLKGRPSERKRLIDQVIRFAAVLEKQGFCPISPFHGLCTDRHDVFVTDFGQDIGPPGVGSGRNGHLLQEAVRWLERHGGRSIDRPRARALYDFHCADIHSEETRWT